jgi:hypothetical protein
MNSANWLAGKLVHTITVVPGKETSGEEAIANIYGEVEQGDAPDRNIPCLISFSKRRAFTSETRSVVRSYDVVFGLDCKVEVDWEVKDGYDQFNTLMLKQGRITGLSPVIHLHQGVIGWTASVAEA